MEAVLHTVKVLHHRRTKSDAGKGSPRAGASGNRLKSHHADNEHRGGNGQCYQQLDHGKTKPGASGPAVISGRHSKWMAHAWRWEVARQ